MKRFLMIIICLSCLSGLLMANYVPDSIGIKIVDGKEYIIHKVDPGETLYRLSKRYNASVSAIKETNNLQVDGINVGQVLLIPKTSIGNSGNSGRKPKDPEYVIHLVEKGQNLYSISRIYQIKAKDLILWNELEDTNLRIGQKLKVLLPGEVFVAPQKDTIKVASVEPEIPKDTVPVATARADYMDSLDTYRPTTARLDTLPESGQDVSTPIGSGLRRVHIVRDGETLFAIAARYNVSVTQIKTLNRLGDGSLKKGQKLLISGPALPFDEHQDKETLTDTHAGDPLTSSDSLEVEELVQQKLDHGNPNKSSRQTPELPSHAISRKVKDRYSGKEIFCVKEEVIAELAGAEDQLDQLDQEQLFIIHPNLQKGTLVRIENTNTKQFVVAVVADSITAGQGEAKILISSKLAEYLLWYDPEQPLLLTYSIPAG